MDGAYTFVGTVSLPERYRSQVNWSTWTQNSNSIPKGNFEKYNILNGRALLDSLFIFSKKQWKQWLRINHPDKNPSINKELVARVNDSASLYL